MTSRGSASWIVASLAVVLGVGCAGTPKPLPGTSGAVDRFTRAFSCAVTVDHPHRRRCMGEVVASLADAADRDRFIASSSGRIGVEVATRSADLGEGVTLASPWLTLSPEERLVSTDAMPVLLVGRDAGETLPEGVYRAGVVSVHHRAQGRLVVRIEEPDLSAPLPPAYHPMLSFRSWREAASPLWRGIKATLSPLEGFEQPHVHLMEERRGPWVRDIVLIHGLASNPEIWGPLLEALYRRPELVCCTRVWVVSYPSAPPVLVNRLRIATALAKARQRHAIDGDWSGVIIGHSMGGVISRLLTVDPGLSLTDVAFGGPMVELKASTAQRESIEALLQFRPLMRCGHLVTLAAPFDGAPGASGWLARLLASVQPKHVPELGPLRAVAQANASRVPRELRESYLSGVLTSLTTLRSGQPVLARSARLKALPCNTHVSIAGVGRSTGGVDGDGIVPATSALHPQSSDTLELDSGHDVYRHPDAIRAMLRVIDEARSGSPSRPASS